MVIDGVIVMMRIKYIIKPKRFRKVALHRVYLTLVAIRSQLELTRSPKHIDWSLLFGRGLSVEEEKIQRKIGTVDTQLSG